jgi:hypothetical protein
MPCGHSERVLRAGWYFLKFCRMVCLGADNRTGVRTPDEIRMKSVACLNNFHLFAFFRLNLAGTA